jgi:hypothetical protein
MTLSTLLCTAQYLLRILVTVIFVPLQLCKIDSEGKARKVVGCSCVVVKVTSYFLLYYIKQIFWFITGKRL